MIRPDPIQGVYPFRSTMDQFLVPASARLPETQPYWWPNMQPTTPMPSASLSAPWERLGEQSWEAADGANGDASISPPNDSTWIERLSLGRARCCQQARVEEFLETFRDTPVRSARAILPGHS